ncbi:Imm1 family immunity protein (plasmid) [Kitasatospora purpeofusca]|uniref:Imm1 family immunity protein n=1 Tax=Kitasatospora purpeofusca TaxID=67352 RepID=UPI002E159F82|nr:Imm1 family immunity protein [Kitasatospora purpeofusca]
MSLRAEVRYRRGRIEPPDHLDSLEDVDVLIDELLAGPVNENLAQIIHLDRESIVLRDPGRPGTEIPDHELQVGVDRELQVGVLLFIDRSGNFVTAGPESSRNAPEYYLAGHWTQFRDQVEIPLDLVREAVKEFLSSGGQRPTCVPWKNQYLDD